jgi:tetratricopeptide (TPR) repeat protein
MAPSSQGLKPPGNLGRFRSGSLGYAHLEHGDHARAIPRLQDAIDGTRRFGARQFEGWFSAVLGEAYRLAGDFERARDAASHALVVARETNNRHAIGWAQRTLARIARHAASADAMSRMLEALATFEEAHACFEAARTRLDLVEIATTQGDLGTASRYLTGVAELFTASGAPRYVERATALASRLGVPLTTTGPPAR